MEERKKDSMGDKLKTNPNANAASLWGKRVTRQKNSVMTDLDTRVQCMEEEADVAGNQRGTRKERKRKRQHG